MRFLGKHVMVIFFSFAVLLFISACENKRTGDASTGGNGMGAQSKVIPLTKIEFVEMEHDFGKIDQGQVVEYMFKFKNVGDNPLVIEDARATCGCTIPDWTKEAVQPGQEGNITVKYNSKGRKGMINKKVTVYSNTDPKETILDIKAEVLEPENPPFKN